MSKRQFQSTFPAFTFARCHCVQKTAIEICREMWFSTTSSDASADRVDDLQPLIDLAPDPLFHHVVKSVSELLPVAGGDW